MSKYVHISPVAYVNIEELDDARKAIEEVVSVNNERHWWSPDLEDEILSDMYKDTRHCLKGVLAEIKDEMRKEHPDVTEFDIVFFSPE